jgi:two-component system sensor histidine kinase GlrK
MRFPRPRSLNGLILVGFGLVALPLLIAVVWALVNLDEVLEQSEQLVYTGVEAAENTRRMNEQLSSLERAARQFQVLKNPDSLQLMTQDLETFELLINGMQPLVAEVDATKLATSLRTEAHSIVAALSDAGADDAALIEAIGRFSALRQRVTRLTTTLSDHVDTKLSVLQETARNAQRVSAWQVAALVPGTFFLILIFTLLVARPIRQIDQAIGLLG